MAAGLLAAAVVGLAPSIDRADRRENGAGKIPNDWFVNQRAFPYAEIPEPSRRLAFREAQLFHSLYEARGTGAWVAAGPLNVGGRLTDIEADPTNPNRVYAGAAAGGVFRSLDMGSTWTPLFDDQTTLSIGALALDPSNPSTIYAGTGEANAAGDNYAGDGIYRSTDQGDTWVNLGLENTGTIGDIEVDPSNPSRVFVAAVGRLYSTGPDRGLYRSVDGGSSWENVLFENDSTGVVSVEIDPVDPTVLYAATWERLRRTTYRRVGGPGSGVFKSTDGGSNWTRLGGGLPPQGPTVGRIGLAIAPSSPSTVYAFYCDDPGNFLGVYKTINAGATWSRVSDGALSDITGGFGWYFGQIRVAPTDPNRVWVIGLELFRSTNGGSSWSDVSGSMHVDHHALWVHPTDVNRLYAGNDGGFYRTTNGTSWTHAVTLPISQFYAITVDPQLPHRLYGGTQDNSTLRTLDGNPSTWDVIYGGDGFYTIVDPLNSNIIYAEYQYGGLGKSTDGGSSWDDATSGIPSGDRRNWSTPVIMDPADHNKLYYGTYRVFRSTNGASSWTAISPDLTGGDPPGGLVFGTLTTLDVAPSNPSALLAGADDGRVSISVNGGGAWTNVSALLPDRWVTRVAFDPTSHLIAYVTFSGYKNDEPMPHLYRTTNAGASWTDISSNLPPVPLNDVIADPENTNVLYVASDSGVYWSANLGASWQPLGSGLPATPIVDLHLHNGSRKLVAGTHGRSMYTFDLDQITVAVDDAASAPEPRVLASPNPFASRATLTLEGGVEATRAQIFDLGGRRIRSLLPDGRGTRFTWDGRNEHDEPVANGTYFYRVEIGSRVVVGKWVVQR
jgi:photosystem II stability/assembly factor-like uncharacterized protein